jgi:hypothetical protein
VDRLSDKSRCDMGDTSRLPDLAIFTLVTFHARLVMREENKGLVGKVKVRACDVIMYIYRCNNWMDSIYMPRAG